MSETPQPSAPARTGGCLCGAVRFTVSASPITVRTCWCRLCQYLGAGSATVNVCFPTESVQITGETRDHITTADSGNIMHRRFCSTCGTPLFSAAERRPHLLFIRAGAMDNREDLAPAATIWTSQAPGWACIDPTIPNLEGQAAPAA
jgi:hypothetical protein